MMTLLMGLAVIFMPVMLPVMIAADSIVGEKERNTLVPLLATPLTDMELLLGKLFTALIPGIIIAYTNLILAVALVNGMAFFMFPSLLWVWPLSSPLSVIQALVMPWLFCSLVVNVMVIISGRVSKVYEAYQMGSVVIIPAMLFAFSGFLSGSGVDWIIFLAGSFILLIADIGLFRLALNLFNRDELITRL